MKTEKQMAAAAAEFAERWKGRGYEKGESQPFWMDLLGSVYGVENVVDFIRYEEQVKVDATNFIDGHITSTKVLIEQKSITKDLRAPVVQSDGSRLTPFQQGKRYSAELPYSERPRWIVTCNFAEFLVYDMEQPNGEPEQILLENLGREYYRLLFLVDSKSEHLSKEMRVSMQAGEIVGEIYEALIAHPIPSPKEGLSETDTYKEFLHDINVLCVRLVFCLYAEDAGIFGRRDMFHDYLAQFDARHLRRALMNLFQVLNTPLDQRDPYLEPDLAQFPYVNGGLFADQKPLPWGGDGGGLEELRTLLLQNASLDFDWSEISPTIFGAVFESTLNPETRRSGGMHYTSIENIHKVIDPLFLGDLRRELDDILEEKVERQRQKKLDAYQERLASLTFLDPACGSGNFLTETYLSLRRLENEVIRERYHGQSFLGLEEVNPVKVSIQQFYGIEINDFAVTVATTALWISEAQMLAETERIIRRDIDFLPLKSYTNIREGNALRIDWSTLEKTAKFDALYTEKLNIYKTDDLTSIAAVAEPAAPYSSRIASELNVVTKDVEYKDVASLKAPSEVPPVTYDYIIGNPPFVGYSLQTAEQKEDTLSTYVSYDGKPYKAAGKIDYVANWFFKAAQLMHNTKTRCAFVSTNSITQGEQVAVIWRPLFERFGIHIDFAHRTFRWDSESGNKAHVHCVIVGFSADKAVQRRKYLYSDGKQAEVENINPYLIAADTVWIENRSKPLCDVPSMSSGGKPVEGGHLIFTGEEKRDFLTREPAAEPYFRPFMSSDDYINGHPRWCLWLLGVTPNVIRSMPAVLQRVEAVREFRLQSVKAATREYANYPTQFMEIKQPDADYLMIPNTSSENRRYIPIGYLDKMVVASNAASFVPNATLYHFGVLTSNVHNAWMRAVCGRLEMRYRYSVNIVYNNFPWPTPTDAQRTKIEQTAQAILDARAKYPDSSLADLYDELTMPAELRRAHQENDRAVMAAYGFPVKSTFTESQCVAELFKLYLEMTK